MARNPRSIWPNTRLVPALLDRSIRVNETALQEAVKHGVAVPVARWLKTINAARRKSGETQLTAEDVRDHYFIPIRDPTALNASREMAKKRDSKLWGRSEYHQTPGRAFIYKGIGETPEQSKMKPFPVSHDLSERIEERAFKGGRVKSLIKFVDYWQEKLRDEYRKALEERDPVALAAKSAGINDLPIPDAVAAFKPLEMPTGDQKTRQVRTKPPYLHLPQDFQENWRIELYTAPHPHRFIEYDRMLRDKINLQAVLEASGISARGGKLFLNGFEITHEKAVDVLAERHAVLSALLVHLLNNRLDHSFTSIGIGSIFTPHNTGPAAFFDLDTIVPKTNSTYNYDVWSGAETIEQGMHTLVFTAHLGKAQTRFFHHEKYVQQYKGLIEKGREYVESKKQSR